MRQEDAGERLSALPRSPSLRSRPSSTHPSGMLRGVPRPREATPAGRARPWHPPRGSTCGAGRGRAAGADWTPAGGRRRAQLSEPGSGDGVSRGDQPSGGRAAESKVQLQPAGPGRDGAAAAPRRAHALSGPRLGPALPAPPAAPVPVPIAAGMMCLECASAAAAGGAEEEEADAERRRRRRGAQRGAGGAGCCGTRAGGASGASSADDEVQTLSGSVRRAPSAAPSTPSRAAAAKGPGAQPPKPASLGGGRGAAAAILSLGNVLNYLDRYTVAGERGSPLPGWRPRSASR